MRIQVDKIMIEKMNETYGLNLTYADFKKFYIEVVKVAKEKDPKTIRRRLKNEDGLVGEIMDYIYNNQEVMEKVRNFGYEHGKKIALQELKKTGVIKGSRNFYKIPKKYKEYEEFESDFNHSAFLGYSSTCYENLPKGK